MKDRTNNTLKRDFGDDDYKNDPLDKAEDNREVHKELLNAVYQQNKLLQNVFNKMAEYMNKESASTTEDYDYIRPYLKQDIHENVDKKTLQYQYSGDDDD